MKVMFLQEQSFLWSLFIDCGHSGALSTLEKAVETLHCFEEFALMDDCSVDSYSSSTFLEAFRSSALSI